jgi:hypothetical protein
VGPTPVARPAFQGPVLQSVTPESESPTCIHRLHPFC